MLSASQFYSNYYGHPVESLSTLYSTILEQQPTRPVLFLAGDSSLDNKHWLFPEPANMFMSKAVDMSDESFTGPAPRLYRKVLDPPRAVKDVAFWMDKEIGDHVTTVNCAIEATTLAERANGLLAQDIFIRDHLTYRDILVISIGANDIAMRPTLRTMMSMATLLLTPIRFINGGWAPGLSYFVKMFRDTLRQYVEKLVQKQKPRAVIICMIYFPDESVAQLGWADFTLSKLGYNSNPQHLQAVIRKVYELGTKKIVIPGTRIIPCALFEVLDGKTSVYYKERVEPSVQGGQKMAARFSELLKTELDW
ncbi:MAG: hypothetical protein M1827_002788 [Pycnora praestabilis]|nr:MAG: hypothetical protein M1827_002788 [Pycnora praestabilis]